MAVRFRPARITPPLPPTSRLRPPVSREWTQPLDEEEAREADRMTVAQLCQAVIDFSRLYPNQVPCVPVGREGESTLVGTARYVADALDRRGRDLERAVRETQAELNAREQWLAHQSHEVRNPIQALLGTLELLLERETDLAKREELEMACHASRQLCEKLNQMLDYTKVNQDEAPPVWDEIHAREFIHRTVLLYRANAENKGLNLSLRLAPNLPEMISTDSDRLKRLLANLVSNAIKFTATGCVDVIVNLVEQAGQNQLIVEVRDTGIGIPEENLRKLFRPYVQADPSIARQYGGTGLGLVICKRLVERAGGSIDITSQPGKGTRCAFTLPVRLLEAPEESAGPVAGTRVLIADDEAPIRRIVRAVLERMGFQVDEVEDGESAAKLAASRPYDLVLMDVTMPGLDGFSVARAIRQGGGASSQAHLMALTGLPEFEIREAWAEAGMDSFLPKPFGIQELRQAVEKIRVRA